MSQVTEWKLAVGQVWDYSGDHMTSEPCDVLLVDEHSRYVIVKSETGEPEILNPDGFRDTHKILNHESGADIDDEKYEYFEGMLGNLPTDFAWAFWDGSHWSKCVGSPLVHLWRREKSVEEEKPWVDCPVDQSNLTFSHGEIGMVYVLSSAYDKSKFIGYVYDDGELLHLPRFYVDEKTPAQIPTHVRFAQ